MVAELACWLCLAFKMTLTTWKDIDNNHSEPPTPAIHGQQAPAANVHVLDRCCLVAWIVGWLVGWLGGWLGGRLSGWRLALLVGWAVAGLVSFGWLLGWLSGGWLVGCLIGLLVGWLARCVESA